MSIASHVDGGAAGAAVWGAVPGPERALDVLALGEISLDRVLEVDVLPSAERKARASREERRPGGQSATAALGCARLGLRVAYAGVTGDDEAAALALAPLETAGVDLRGVQRSAGVATRGALVLVQVGDGERCVVERRDPRARLEPARLDRDFVAGARLLLADATDPDAALWAMRIARRAGTAVMLDADTAGPGLGEMLALSDFPVLPRRLAEEIGGSSSVRTGLAALRAHGARVAVATLGAAGALARTGDGELGSGAFEIEARDTTGAGDAFHAGLAAAILAGLGLDEALRRANAVAAANCLERGAQGGLPTPSGLARFLEAKQQRPWRDPDGP